jgi:hypothetical protein
MLRAHPSALTTSRAAAQLRRCERELVKERRSAAAEVAQLTRRCDGCGGLLRPEPPHNCGPLGSEGR